MFLFSRKFKYKYNPEAVTGGLVRYLDGLKGPSGLSPKRLFIYPAILCDDNCKYCNDGLHHQGSDSVALAVDPRGDFFSDRKRIDKLVRDIRGLGIIDVHLFGGGEPFFYKDNMIYFLKKLKNIDVFIRVITNTKCLEEEDVRQIVKHQLISQMNISFNSDSDQTAGKIYSDSSRHRHTLDVLNWISKYKRLYKTDFPKIDIMFIVLNVNYARIIEIIGLLDEFGINYFFFQPLRVYTEKQKQFQLSTSEQDDLEKMIPGIESRLNSLKIRSNVNELKRKETGVPAISSTEAKNALELKNSKGLTIDCYMPLTTISICYNGNMPFCQFNFRSQYSKNYFDIPGLGEFIKEEEYSGFVNKFVGSGLPVVCRGCNFCVPSELNTIRECMLGSSKGKGNG